MKNVTNAINSMLHLYTAPSPLSSEYVDSTPEAYLEHMPVGEEEQALSVITHCVQTFGGEAMQELEQHIERLQEDFLAHVHSRLAENKITLKEKLVLSLSNENMLLLQCQEYEEALLSAFGEDDELQKRLQALRAAAFLSQGLQYIIGAKQEKPEEHLGDYKVCIKGMLSHFYLR